VLRLLDIECAMVSETVLHSRSPSEAFEVTFETIAGHDHGNPMNANL
jgi:hypothetical protein